MTKLDAKHSDHRCLLRFGMFIQECHRVICPQHEVLEAPTRRYKLRFDSDIIRGRPVQFDSGKVTRNGLAHLLHLC